MWRLQYEKTRLLESLWAEKGRFNDKCSALWKPKGIQNHTFKDVFARGPFKNVLREGVGKKHENSLKFGSENGGILSAQHHVWRYTLRL